MKEGGTKKAISELGKADIVVRSAKDAFASKVRLVLPIGTKVHWHSTNAYPQCGKVVGHDKYDRVEVQNFNTGKNLWLYIHQIVEYPRATVETVKEAAQRSREWAARFQPEAYTGVGYGTR